MPFNGLAIDSQAWFDVTLQDMSPQVFPLAKFLTRYLNRLDQAPVSCQRQKHEWSDPREPPQAIVIEDAILDGTANITFTCANGEGKYLLPNDVFVNDDTSPTGERIKIVSSTADETVAKRAVSSTSHSAYDANSKWKLVTHASMAGATPGQNQVRPPHSYENGVQRINWPVVTAQDANVNNFTGGIADAHEYGVAEGLKVVMKVLQRTALLGKRDSESYFEASEPLMCDGVLALVERYGAASADGGLIYTSQPTGESFTSDNLAAYVHALSVAGNIPAGRNLLCACSSTYKRLIDKFPDTLRTTVVTESGGRRYTELVSTYECDDGVLDIFSVDDLPPYTILIHAPNQVSIPPARGRSLAREDYSKTGDFLASAILGNYSVEAHRPDTILVAQAEATLTY